MDRRSLHDGRTDGLLPLESLSPNEIHSFADLVRAMSKTAFSGRQVGEAFEILLAMSRNPACRVVLTLSGAMTVFQTRPHPLRADRPGTGARSGRHRSARRTRSDRVDRFDPLPL